MESPLPGAVDEDRAASVTSTREEILEMQRKRLQRRPMSVMVQPTDARPTTSGGLNSGSLARTTSISSSNNNNNNTASRTQSTASTAPLLTQSGPLSTNGAIMATGVSRSTTPSRTLSATGRRNSDTSLFGPTLPTTHEAPPASPHVTAAEAAEYSDLTQKIAKAGFSEHNPEAARFELVSPAGAGAGAGAGGSASGAGSTVTSPRRPLTAQIQTNLGQQSAEDFVTRPAPMGELVQCVVVRDKSGLDKMHPTYYLKLQKSDDTKVFLLAGRRRRRSKTSNYLISLDATDMSRDGDSYIAKLRGNFVGTEFTLYDGGRNPSKDENQEKPVRKELGLVNFETNVFGLKGPRKMTVVMPAINESGMPVDFQPTKIEDTLSERLKVTRLSDLLVLHNKQPTWNAETQSHVLNFNGRVTMPSVKNFQIIHESDPNYIIMQFGRIDNHDFTLDYRYPMSAVQAFAIALSSFDGKLAVE